MSSAIMFLKSELLPAPLAPKSARCRRLAAGTMCTGMPNRNGSSLLPMRMGSDIMGGIPEIIKDDGKKRRGAPLDSPWRNRHGEEGTAHPTDARLKKIAAPAAVGRSSASGHMRTIN
jgi:hypothetical protein